MVDFQKDVSSSEFLDAVKKLDEYVQLVKPSWQEDARQTNKRIAHAAKLERLDAEEEAAKISGKAADWESRGRPWEVQALSRGWDGFHRKFGAVYGLWEDEATMQEFYREDERLGEAFDMAMDMGDVSGLRQFGVNAIKNVSDMVLTTAVVGGQMPGVYAMYGLDTLSREYHGARASGLSKGDAWQTAGAMAGIEVGVMGAFHAASKVLPGLGGAEAKLASIVRTYLPKSAKSTAAALVSEGVTKIVRNDLKSKAGRFLRHPLNQALWQGGAEVTEELITAVGQTSIQAGMIPGAENVANWTDKNGDFSWDSPMMKTLVHVARDTAGAMMLMFGPAPIKHSIRRYLSRPTRTNAKAVEDLLLAAGAINDIKDLKTAEGRQRAQKILLTQLRAGKLGPEIEQIAEQYGVDAKALTDGWNIDDSTGLPKDFGEDAYEVVPGIVLGDLEGGRAAGEVEQAERAIVQFHNTLAADLGYKLRIVETGDVQTDGVHVAEDKTIWVTRQRLREMMVGDPGLKDAATGLYLHEFSHALERQGGYEELYDYVYKNFKGDLLSHQAEYKRINEEAGGEELSFGALKKEGLARWMQKELLKSGMLHKLAKENSTLFERIRNWVFRVSDKWSNDSHFAKVYEMVRDAARKAGLPPKAHSSAPVEAGVDGVGADVSSTPVSVPRSSQDKAFSEGTTELSEGGATTGLGRGGGRGGVSVGGSTPLASGGEGVGGIGVEWDYPATNEQAQDDIISEHTQLQQFLQEDTGGTAPTDGGAARTEHEDDTQLSDTRIGTAVNPVTQQTERIEGLIRDYQKEKQSIEESDRPESEKETLSKSLDKQIEDALDFIKNDESREYNALVDGEDAEAAQADQEDNFEQVMGFFQDLAPSVENGLEGHFSDVVSGNTNRRGTRTLDEAYDDDKAALPDPSKHRFLEDAQASALAATEVFNNARAIYGAESPEANKALGAMREHILARDALSDELDRELSSSFLREESKLISMAEELASAAAELGEAGVDVDVDLLAAYVEGTLPSDTVAEVEELIESARDHLNWGFDERLAELREEINTVSVPPALLNEVTDDGDNEVPAKKEKVPAPVPKQQIDIGIEDVVVEEFDPFQTTVEQTTVERLSLSGVVAEQSTVEEIRRAAEDYFEITEDDLSASAAEALHEAGISWEVSYDKDGNKIRTEEGQFNREEVESWLNEAEAAGPDLTMPSAKSELREEGPLRKARSKWLGRSRAERRRAWEETSGLFAETEGDQLDARFDRTKRQTQAEINSIEDLYRELPTDVEATASGISDHFGGLAETQRGRNALDILARDLAEFLEDGVVADDPKRLALSLMEALDKGINTIGLLSRVNAVTADRFATANEVVSTPLGPVVMFQKVTTTTKETVIERETKVVEPDLASPSGRLLREGDKVTIEIDGKEVEVEILAGNNIRGYTVQIEEQVVREVVDVQIVAPPRDVRTTVRGVPLSESFLTVQELWDITVGLNRAGARDSQVPVAVKNMIDGLSEGDQHVVEDGSRVLDALPPEVVAEGIETGTLLEKVEQVVAAEMEAAAAEPTAAEIDWNKAKQKWRSGGGTGRMLQRNKAKDGYTYGGVLIQDVHAGLDGTDPKTVSRWRVWSEAADDGGSGFDTLKAAQQFIREEYANLTKPAAEPFVAKDIPNTPEKDLTFTENVNENARLDELDRWKADGGTMELSEGGVEALGKKMLARDDFSFADARKRAEARVHLADLNERLADLVDRDKFGEEGLEDEITSLQDEIDLEEGPSIQRSLRGLREPHTEKLIELSWMARQAVSAGLAGDIPEWMRNLNRYDELSGDLGIIERGLQRISGVIGIAPDGVSVMPDELAERLVEGDLSPELIDQIQAFSEILLEDGTVAERRAALRILGAIGPPTGVKAPPLGGEQILLVSDDLHAKLEQHDINIENLKEQLEVSPQSGKAVGEALTKEAAKKAFTAEALVGRLGELQAKRLAVAAEAEDVSDEAPGRRGDFREFVRDKLVTRGVSMNAEVAASEMLDEILAGELDGPRLSSFRESNPHTLTQALDLLFPTTEPDKRGKDPKWREAGKVKLAFYSGSMKHTTGDLSTAIASLGFGAAAKQMQFSRRSRIAAWSKEAAEKRMAVKSEADELKGELSILKYGQKVRESLDAAIFKAKGRRRKLKKVTGRQFSLRDLDGIENDARTLRDAMKAHPREPREAASAEWSKSVKAHLKALGKLKGEIAAGALEIEEAIAELKADARVRGEGARANFKARQVVDGWISTLSRQIETLYSESPATVAEGYDDSIRKMEKDLGDLLDKRDVLSAGSKQFSRRESTEDRERRSNLQSRWAYRKRGGSIPADVLNDLDQLEGWLDSIDLYYSDKDTTSHAEENAAAARNLAEDGEVKILERMRIAANGIDGKGEPVPLAPVDSINGQKLAAEAQREHFADPENQEKSNLAADIIQNLLRVGSAAANALHFTARLTPEEKIARAVGDAYFFPPPHVAEKARKHRQRGEFDKSKEVLDHWKNGKGRGTLHSLRAALVTRGFDLAKYEQIIADPMEAQRMLSAIGEHNATLNDKMFEFWRNAILSGPATQMANLMGTAIFTAYEVALKRNLIAAMNLGLQDPNLPTFGENMALIRAMAKSGATDAITNAIQAFDTEQHVLEYKLAESGLDVRTGQVGKFGAGGKTSIYLGTFKNPITGKKTTVGRQIRIPQRTLLMVDEWMKTSIANGYAAGAAYRAAQKQIKAGKLTKEQSPAFIEELLDPNNRSEMIWLPAFHEALRQTWQTPLGKFGQQIVSARESYPALRFVMPFIVTPINIFKTGLDMSPLMWLPKAIKWEKMRRDGDIAETRVEELGADAANAILLGIPMLMVMGQDEDDPWVTGSEASVLQGRDRFSSGREGELPPYSVKLPFTNKWFSYSRIEPFATAFGVTVDLARAIKSGAEGEIEKSLSISWASVYGQLTEKTFIRGIGEIAKSARRMNEGDIVGGFGNYVSQFAVSWVPNLIRAPARALQGSKPERRAYGEDNREKLWRLWEGTMKKTEILPALGVYKDLPKVDMWGRDFPRHKSFGVGGGLGDFLYKLVVPVQIKSTHMFVGDQTMRSWNNNNPDEQYTGPEAPERYFKKKNKKKWMSPEQYEEFCRMSGSLAAELCRTLDLDVDNPTQLDIKKIKDSHLRARAITKLALVEKWWGSGDESLILAATAEGLRRDMIKAKSRILAKRRPTYKNLSPEQKRLPYEQKMAILQKKREELELMQEESLQFLISEGVTEDVSARSYGERKGLAAGRRNIRKTWRTSGVTR